MNKNDTAVEREKAGKMFELNEKYKDFPERISEYEIDGKKYIVDSSLDIIAGELQPKTFFRISRSCIVSIKAIQSIVKQAGGRLLIVSEPAADFEMTVSRSRVDDFMVWIAQ